MIDKTQKVQAAPHPFYGRVISNRYEIIDMLGEGGGGSVFLAEHVSLRKKIAIKILNKTAADEKSVQRLETEARACALLDHPGLVSVIDFGIEDDGTPFLAMEFVPGDSLEKLLTSKSIGTPLRVLKIAQQAAAALAYAHDRGVIHRDIKPANMVITRGAFGEQETVKILDFGIAKVVQSEGEMQRLTTTGEVFGSPSYMSPEQVRGEEVDQRTDIYSLGCVLYECLTGRKAFRGESSMATMSLHLDSNATPLNTVRPELSKWSGLENAVMRCLEKDKENRYASMKEFSQTLAECERSWRTNSSRKRILQICVSVIVLVVLVGIASLAIWQPQEQNQTPEDAIQKTSTTPKGKPGRNSPSSGAAARALSNEKGAEKYATSLAQAEIVYQSDRIESACNIMREALEDARLKGASDAVQLALGSYAMSCVRENEDLSEASKLLASLKTPINNVVNDASNQTNENMLAADVYYQYGTLQFELAQEETKPVRLQNLMKNAIDYCTRALKLALRMNTEDSKAQVRRIRAKLKEISKWRK